jgi:hypothetical protein
MMKFVDGYNVNDKQRDQYKCDQMNLYTGVINGALSMVQGQKNETNKYKSVLPRFTVSVFKTVVCF